MNVHVYWIFLNICYQISDQDFNGRGCTYQHNLCHYWSNWQGSI